jgi:hypothetical protein
MDLSSETGERRVRVRVNFSGRRYVGVVAVPEGTTRVSDVLNDGSHFLTLEEAHTRDGAPAGGLALNKQSITFIQALEDAPHTIPALRRRGGFVPVEVAMSHLELVIRGKIFVPDGMNAAEILNDERNFLSLSDVEVVGTPESFPFLALCKAQVVSVEIMEPEVAHTGR